MAGEAPGADGVAEEPRRSVRGDGPTPGDANPRPLFDSHLHIIDPRFPLEANQGYLPAPFTCQDCLCRVRPLGIRGGTVVSGSFQGFDQSYLIDALGRLGPTFVGVTQLPADVPDRRIAELEAAGVRAVRFNLRRGGSAAVGDIPRLASRVWDLAGWHAEFYLDSRELASLAPVLRHLPRICVDHLGLSRQGLPNLLRLVERGAYVKASGFGRGDLAVPEALRAICEVNPGALLFGTDLPSTRSPHAFCDEDLQVVHAALGPDLAWAVLFDNGVALYRPRVHPRVQTSGR
jgi:predicted TIM-barrel fold metal-dependent hydrolase